MNKHVASALKTFFTELDAIPSSLSADVAASLPAAVGDVTFIQSASGKILDVAVTQRDLANHGFTDWIGDAWIDTVTTESRPKVTEMLAAVSTLATPRWRQLNHPAAGGDVPMRYLVMGLGAGPGGADRLIAIGRDMRGAAAMQQRLLQTQQALERDYIRLRQTETRYRMLFDMASEPVLIIDAPTRRIREANPAAQRLIDDGEGSLIGAAATMIVDPQDSEDLIAHLGAAEAAEDILPVVLRLRGARGEAKISAKLFGLARTPLLIVRVDVADARIAARPFDTPVNEVVERMPDSFVLTDRDLKVLTANASFAELAEMPSSDRIVGGHLAAWLGRPGIDLELIVRELRQHGSVRNLATILRGAAGAEEEVEVSGAVAPMGNSECYGFTIRNVGRRQRVAPADPRDLPRSVEQLTELVGRMSLKEIVRESTDLIERLCIESALTYTSGNRAAASEVLGVSRQSLYSKLHRHGLVGTVPHNE